MKKETSYKRLGLELQRDFEVLVKKRVKETVGHGSEFSSWLDELIALTTSSAAATTAEQKAETRRLLDSVRNGTATEEERQRVFLAVQRMNKECEPSAKSKLGQQTYLLTLRYLAPERYELKQIASLVNLDVSSVFRNIQAARERLAFWLFASDRE